MCLFMPLLVSSQLQWSVQADCRLAEQYRVVVAHNEASYRGAQVFKRVGWLVTKQQRLNFFKRNFLVNYSELEVGSGLVGKVLSQAFIWYRMMPVCARWLFPFFPSLRPACFCSHLLTKPQARRQDLNKNAQGGEKRL